MKFETTSCSHCHATFGPGDHGYSHCKDHQKFANARGYSDVDPYEVVRHISDQTIEVREMDAVRDESVKLDWAVGGFAGHCVNQRNQKWIITSNPSNRVIRIRLNKNGVWKDKHGRRFSLSDKPVKFYDYNF
jgi:hypothetical protein